MFFKCDGVRRKYIERTSDIFSPMIIFPGEANTTHGTLGSFGTPAQPELDLWFCDVSNNYEREQAMMVQESTTIPTTDTNHNPTQITADYSNNNSDTSPDSLEMMF